MATAATGSSEKFVGSFCFKTCLTSMTECLFSDLEEHTFEIQASSGLFIVAIHMIFLVILCHS